MSTHLDNLIFYIPDLSKRKILDVGAGKGGFLIECAERGFIAKGIEDNQDNIIKTKEFAKNKNLDIDITHGTAKNILFPNDNFEFLNLSEVIEHVKSPIAVLKETHRVLVSGGIAYVSTPNRFGWFDPHFHLAFVNWALRSWSDIFISFFRKHKDYSGRSGLQRLREMHYYTHNGFISEAHKVGFTVQDMREIKIGNKFRGNIIILFFTMVVYKILRPWYFDSFHFKLTKNG